MSSLPDPGPEALLHSQRLVQRVADEIAQSGGWISFARYMELALYAPGLGYYSAGARKFGVAGDFVTAPELTPLFGRTLARQVAEVLGSSGGGVLELGAGSGRLALDLLSELERLGCLPEHYAILEISPDLRQRQRQLLEEKAPHLVAMVSWLDALPASFHGVVLANEVLDALPVHLVSWHEGVPLERGVTLSASGKLDWADRPVASAELLRTAAALPVEAVSPGGDYLSEIALSVPALVRSLGDSLQQGCVFFIDYGFPRHEYYHPQRSSGTLMCHYRHHAFDAPFYLPGLTDITAHVDFTAVAEAALESGLEVLGYANQAQFLVNCGVLEVLSAAGVGSAEYARSSAAVQKLLSPSEMGELFKVMALGKGLAIPLMGFGRGDRRHTL